MSETVFGMTHDAVYSGGTEELFAVHHRMLAPTNVGPLAKSLVTHASRIFAVLGDGIPQGNLETTLDAFVHPAVYEAVALTLLGPEFPAMQVSTCTM